MARQEFRLAFCDFCELAFESIGDARVKPASRPAQQGPICGILYQRVLEQICRMRRHTLPQQQTGSR